MVENRQIFIYRKLKNIRSYRYIIIIIILTNRIKHDHQVENQRGKNLHYSQVDQSLINVSRNEKYAA